jgi:hypothetical protein
MGKVVYLCNRYMHTEVSFVTMKKPCLVYWEEPFENMLNIEYECGNWFMLLSVLAYNLEQINAEKARLL